MADPKIYINEEPTGATVPMFALSVNTTTKAVKEWDGANWNPIRSGGATHVTERPTKAFFISAGGYLYEGFAAWGSATSAAVWQMFRTPSAGGATQRADNGNFTQIADSYASLTYGD